MRILQQRLQLRWLTLNSEKDNEEPLQKCRGSSVVSDILFPIQLKFSARIVKLFSAICVLYIDKNPIPEPAQMFFYKESVNGLPGQYRVEEEKQYNDSGKVHGENTSKYLCGQLFPKTGEAIENHQYYKYHAGEIMIQEGEATDKHPGKVLCEITYKQKRRFAVSVIQNTIEDIQEGGNSGPPYKGIAHGADAFSYIALQNAGIIPYRPGDEGPAVKGGRKGMGCIQRAVVGEHGLLIAKHSGEKGCLRTIPEGKVGKQVNDCRYQDEENNTEQDGF